jgi:hypothetical protein
LKQLQEFNASLTRMMVRCRVWLFTGVAVARWSWAPLTQVGVRPHNTCRRVT